jgi:hypothetical protein
MQINYIKLQNLLTYVHSNGYSGGQDVLGRLQEPDPQSPSFLQHLADAKVVRVVKRSKSEKTLSLILSFSISKLCKFYSLKSSAL